ncbi:FAD-dependent oxidoreductase, partial [Lysinibacillus sp. D4A3_S15]|uniref:FAD-dependent oxidoreductase n=1 Tax=Lysinibacillus sp. D4A3_S15 TaxID=2941227 RepID=UPI0020C0697F
VKDWFEKHNVDVIANFNITKVEPGKIFNHEDEILLDKVVWTAGVQPVKIVRDMDVEKDKQGRPIVTQYFNVLLDEHVY